MIALKPTLMRYDWGTPDGLPRVLGIEPDGGPYAEAWWGAHPLAPSATPRGYLDAVIASDPEAALGSDVAARYSSLPYLLKLLSIARPLSIQVHPSLARAALGFAQEEADGVPLGAHERTFKDASHKPEMLVAVTELTLLSGFREVDAVARDLEALGPVAEGLLSSLREGGLAGYMAHCLSANPGEALDALVSEGPGIGGSAQVAALAALAFPLDPGALVALAMNVVRLAPGEALYTPARIVHCYVSGLGVEIMANSDNVVRAGLTSKAVRTDLLADIALLEPTHPVIPDRVVRDAGVTLVTEAEEFSLTVVSGGTATAETGPRIVLAVEGDATVSVAREVVALGRGEAVFISASEGVAEVSASGLAVIASVPAPPG